MDSDIAGDLVRSIPDMVFILDQSGMVVDYNPVAAALLDRIDRIRIDDVLFVPRNSALEVLLSNEESISGMTEFYTRFSAESGKRTLYCIFGKMEGREEDKVLFYLFVKPIPDRGFSDDAQIRAMLIAEERERSRIFRELHDSIGQQLTALKFFLRDNIMEGEREELRNKLGECRQLVNEIIRELRHVCYKVMPAALERSGCVESIRDLVHRLSRFSGCSISFEVEGDVVPLNERLHITLYRIVQESLNNMVKYAKAKEGGVRMRFTRKKICLTVEDRGVGIVDESQLHLGNGFKNMLSRARAEGGTLYLDSEPEKGTRLEFEFPFERD